MPPVRAWAALLVAGTAWPAAAKRILILPVEAIGAYAAQAQNVSDVARQAFAERTDGVATVVSASAPADCASRDECILREAGLANADLALAIGVAGLGTTHVVRLRLYDATTGALRREARESVMGGPEELLRRVRVLVRALLPPTPTVKWRAPLWLRIGGAAAVIGAAIALPLVFRSSDDGVVPLDGP
jgi:hypothetical protein